MTQKKTKFLNGVLNTSMDVQSKEFKEFQKLIADKAASLDAKEKVENKFNKIIRETLIDLLNLFTLLP